jgi:hypothetical protein
MEYRNDLARVLLSGLPDSERDHIVDVIHQVDAEKLRRKRASDDDPQAPSGELTDGQLDEMDDESVR